MNFPQLRLKWKFWNFTVKYNAVTSGQWTCKILIHSCNHTGVYKTMFLCTKEMYIYIYKYTILCSMASCMSIFMPCDRKGELGRLYSIACRNALRRKLVKQVQSYQEKYFKNFIRNVKLLFANKYQFIQ